MDQIFSAATQLGGTVFVVVAFLYFLEKNKEAEIKSRTDLTATLQNLINTVEKNISFNIQNIETTQRNTQALKENTNGIK